MRKSSLLIAGFLISGLILTGLLLLHPLLTHDLHQKRIVASRTVVKALGLTDLCLFTEASYTRHLTLADRHTAFGDHPLSMEHFPSGSLTQPPSSLFEVSGASAITLPEARD